MAEWEHKESTWLSPAYSTAYEIKGEHWADIDGAAVYEAYKRGLAHERATDNMSKEQKDKVTEQTIENREEFNQWKTRAITFSEWLDLNCKGGWEAFHISKEVSYEKGNSANGWPRSRTKTWCLFRKKN